MTDHTEEVLKAGEVARKLRIGRNAAYALMREEGFPAFQVGRQLRVPAAALDRWMAERAGRIT